MRVLWAVLVWMAMCSFATSACAEDAAVPVPRDDEALMPIPDVPPPGWSAEQLASLRRMEIRLLHTDTEPEVTDGKSTVYWVNVAPWDPEQPAGPPLCIKRLRITTDVGILRYPRWEDFPARTADECMNMWDSFSEAPRSPGHMGISTRPLKVPPESRPERFRVRKAEIDVAPALGAAGHAATLRRLDVRERLRSVPTPTLQLVTPKGPLPVAGPEADAVFSDPWTKGGYPCMPSKKVRVHLQSMNVAPGRPDMRAYQLAFAPVPRGSDGYGGMRVWTDVGYAEENSKFVSSPFLFFADPGITQITIRKFKVWSLEKRAWIDGMPLLVRYDFKRLPFVMDEETLPPSSPGWILD